MLNIKWQGVIAEIVLLYVPALATVGQMQVILVSINVICIPPIFKKPLNKKGGKNKSKRRMRVTAQARFNICIHNVPLTAFRTNFGQICTK
jgi:hypothetical protein